MAAFFAEACAVKSAVFMVLANRRTWSKVGLDYGGGLVTSEQNLSTLAQLVRTFCEERDWDQFHGPKDLAIGLVTEAAELLEHFRFQTSEQCQAQLTDERGRRRIADELADCLFFILRMSDRWNFSLEEELVRKIQQNAEKYPVDKFRGSNQKYNTPTSD